jgi:uncharacterized protein
VLLSDDKISHLAHLILKGLNQDGRAKFVVDEDKVLREIKRVMIDEVKAEEEIDLAVRNKLLSYSRPIYEGSPEWEVLYQKFFVEEHKKRTRR